MIKNIIVLGSFFLLTTVSYAWVLEKNKWNNFDGKIDNKAVVLSLFLFEDGQMKGDFFFKNKEEKTILSGQLKNDIIILNENNTNKFTLQINNTEDDNFFGHYFDAKSNKTFDVNFILKSVCEGDFEHRYVRFESKDADVEKFAKQVKNAILTNNKEWLKNHCDYPLLAQEGDGVFVNVRTKEQFIKEFSLIFPNKIKENIKNTYTINMDYSYFQGVSIGSPDYMKYITINEFVDPLTKKLKLVITSVSNVD